METKILIYIITAVLTILLTYFLFKKYKLSTYQMTIFILLTLFWSANVVIRAYRKSYAINPIELGGLELDFAKGALIASGYGFISIFARGIILFLSDYIQSRKKVIFTGLLSVLLTGVWVLLAPDFSSLLSSSLALGISASMLSLFNLFFAETFEEKDAMLSVSILSIAPLLAEFIMSSFQYAFTIKSEENYPALWLISIIVSLMACVFLFFVKEPQRKEQKRMNRKSFSTIVRNKTMWMYAVIGILISLIRFSTSGSNLITYFQSDLVNMGSFFVAYSDFAYAITQLIAGVLVGTVLSRKFGLKKTLLVGIFCGCIFNFLLLVTYNPEVLFYASMLQGFSYGITYNSLIGLTMMSVDLSLRDMSMAFFQTFFAVGIFYGDMIYKTIADIFKGETVAEMYHKVFTFIFILSILLFVFIAIFVRDRKETVKL